MKYLIHDYAGHPFQVQLSRELALRGHSVVHAYAGGLVTPRGALQARADDPKSFSVVEVPMSPDYRANKYSFLKRRGYELAYGWELAALVQRVKPDLVISANTPTEPQWTMIKAARSSCVPVVTWLQDFYSIAVAKLAMKKWPVLGNLVGAWYQHLDGKCLRASAGVIVITDDFVPIVQRFGVSAEKIEVIPNWAPLDELPRKPRNNGWSVRNGLEGKFILHYSGTLAMKHNPDLLRQLAVHFADDPAVRVVVVSEGPGADYLQMRKVAEKLDNLLLLPFQLFADMPEMLASSDVLIAVLEADAGVFSVPSKVLTYHTAERAILGAIPLNNLAARILKQQGSGFCVAPDDSEGFVKAAARLREDSIQRDKMAKAARKYAEGEFDIKRLGDHFEAFFTRMQNGSH
jgi:colanic acid biosynthesis glycosyl transferase WcaI